MDYSPEPEAGPHAEDLLALRVALDGPLEAEEGVVLHGALPQVLTRALAVEAKHKRVLLLPSLTIKSISN